MKISLSKPPVYDECLREFPTIEDDRPVFSYGDTLYNPFNIAVPDHLTAHEERHAEQQGHDDSVAAIWWKRYLADPVFRTEQEVEAYGAQYRFICGRVKDKNARYRSLHIMAQKLSGPMYGGCVSYTDAMRRIREAA